MASLPYPPTDCRSYIMINMNIYYLLYLTSPFIYRLNSYRNSFVFCLFVFVIG